MFYHIWLLNTTIYTDLALVKELNILICLLTSSLIILLLQIQKYSLERISYIGELDIQPNSSRKHSAMPC